MIAVALVAIGPGRPAPGRPAGGSVSGWKGAAGEEGDVAGGRGGVEEGDEANLEKWGGGGGVMEERGETMERGTERGQQKGS